MSLLTIENIAKDYNNQVVLKEVNLRVERGDRLALVGANGSGKSTLLRIIMGLEEADLGKVTIAKNIKVAYLSQEVKVFKNAEDKVSETALNYEKVARMEARIRELEKQMEELKEDNDSNTKAQLLNEYSKLINRFETMDGYTIESKIKKTMLGLGLRQEALTIPINRLSGGEQVRVTMARNLLEEPDLLILDEPTNHLDIDAIEWLEDFLKNFEGGVLFVSHDRIFLDNVATRIAELDNGGIVEKKCSYSSFIEQKDKMREFALKEQKRLNYEMKNTNKLIEELRRKGKFKASMSREKVFQRKNDEINNKLASIKQVEHLKRKDGPKLSLKNIKHVSKDIAMAEELTKNFGEVKLLDKVSFHIRGGEKIGIIGPNGCGKTTLINILLGKDKEYEGFIRLGEWVNYSYMSQEVGFDDEKRTVLEQLYSIKEMDEATAREYLSKFEFYGEDVTKQINILSGGERVRVYLACIIVEAPDCLIMDEPTNHLDVPAREAVEKALKDFRGTVIAISHDRYYLNNCVDRILEMSNGKIISYEGNYDFYKEVKAKNEEQIENRKVNDNKNRKSKTNKACKESAVLDYKGQDIEEKIDKLHLKIKSLEDSFNEKTSYETYIEYEKLTNEINELYVVWETNNS